MEIERKYLVKYEDFIKFKQDKQFKVISIHDCYLSEGFRIRRTINKDDGVNYIITHKSIGTLCREEDECVIPEKFHKGFISLFEDKYLDKTRFVYELNNKKYEFNVFNNVKQQEKPLVILEVELKDKDEDTLVNSLDVDLFEITKYTSFYGYNLFKRVK